MSLVNDALRKARVEASRHDSSGRGTAYPGWLYSERSDGLGAPVLIGVGAAILIVGALLYWTGVRSGRSKVSDSGVQVTSAAADGAAIGEEPLTTDDVAGTGVGTEQIQSPGSNAGSPADRQAVLDPPRSSQSRQTRQSLNSPNAANPDRSGEATMSVERTPLPKNRAMPTAESQNAGSVRSSPEPSSSPSPVAESREPTRAVEEPALQPVSSTEPAEARQPAAPADATGSAIATSATPIVFVQEATIDGVGSLKLGGIAWSEERPFALINGSVIGPSDIVLGLAVVAIEPRQVILERADGSRYVLKIR